MKYVPLERVFESFLEDEDIEAMIARSTYGFEIPRISWVKILEHRFAIVLGEAGSGKTREFQAQARHLNEAGSIAFFVRTDDLVAQTLQDAINPEDAARLEAWKGGDAEAVFLVDAVDEAKIAHHATAFEKSLRTLTRDLGAARSRTRVVVSCRISDWRPQTDLDTFKSFVERCYPASVAEDRGKGGTQDSEALIVTLARLDAKRIRAFASALDVDDIDAFMKALEEQDLDTFSGRPRDVEWLVAYWQEHRAFGTLQEMLEANIEAKLRERNDLRNPRDPLSPERAREGAEALAAAAMLCKTFAIALPEEAIQLGPTSKIVKPQRVLGAWTENEIHALLTRAVFDPATRCRVRFHHRSTQEYLAACWIAHRHASGVPYTAIRDLLIGEAFGRTYPVPSMVPVLGWLACKIPPLRSELSALAPGVLLFFGDASQIPVEERAAALRHLTSELSGDKRLPWIIEDSDYKRIAHPRLSPVILDLLSSEPCHNETCRMMLRLVEAGRLVDCANMAIQVALDESRAQHVRARAVRAAATAGGADSREQLCNHFSAAATLEESLARELLDALCPTAMDVDACIEIARKTALPGAGFVSSLNIYFEKVVVERCPIRDLPNLLKGLLSLAGLPPMLSSYDGDVISRAFAWAAETMVHVLRRMNEELPIHKIKPAAVAKAYLLLIRSETLAEPSFHVERPEQTLTWPANVNRAVFWHFVLADPDPRRRHWGLLVGNQWFCLSIPDVIWLLEDAVSVERDEERDVVFDSVLRLWEGARRPEDLRANIQQALSRSGASDALSRRIEARLDPPPYEEPQWPREHRLSMEKQQREREARLAEIKFNLEERLEGLRNGADLDALLTCHELMRKGRDSDRGCWGQANWQALIPGFGESVAQAACEGFKVVWRRWRPPLPYEREVANGVEAAVLTGLTGLRIAAEEGMDFATLSPEEAGIASCYALRELNRFPDWMEDLASAHPEVVRSIIAAQIEAELQAAAEHLVNGDVLSAVRYGPESLRQLCLPVILDQLDKGNPRSSDLLRKAVDATLPVDETAKKRLAQIAATRVRRTPHGDRKSMLTWLYVWLQIDAMAACNFLEQECNTEVFGEIPLFLSLAAMFGDDLRWRKDRPNVADWPPGVLEQLMRLSLKYVDPAQDNPLRDGIYHSDVRDRAEDFRGRVATCLGESPGIEAHQALRRLAEDPVIPDNWQALFRRQAEEHAAQATERPPWSEAQVADFGATHETEPETGDALFRVVIDRLRSIKDDIERGDFSDRALFFVPRLPETVMQKWLAGRLERESRGRYSIVRETEVDLKRKPDIRVYHSRAGYVSVEIKPVDDRRYTFRKLVTALEDQLVGQYMRAAGSRHGILVIGMLRCRNWDAVDGSGRIGFSELVMKLNSRAQELVLASQAIQGLSVIGIDFTEPTT